MSDTEDEQGGIAITADEFTREVEALKLLRRRSMSTGGSGNLVIDPDIPPLSSTSGSSPSQASFGEISLDGTSQSFWVGSDSSSSFAFAERVLPEALVERKSSLSWSAAGLGRKKSMLSRQYKPEINDGVGEDENTADKNHLERSLSSRLENPSPVDLQSLDEEPEDDPDSTSTSKSFLRRSIRMDSNSSIVALDLGKKIMDEEADGITIGSKRSKRLSKSSNLRKNSILGQSSSNINPLSTSESSESIKNLDDDRSSIATEESVYTTTEALSPSKSQSISERPDSTFSESSILDAYSRSRESSMFNRLENAESSAIEHKNTTPDELLTPKQSTFFQQNPPASRMFTANFKPVQLSDADEQFDALHASQSHTAQSPDASFESIKSSNSVDFQPVRTSLEHTANNNFEAQSSSTHSLEQKISYSHLLKGLPDISSHETVKDQSNMHSKSEQVVYSNPHTTSPSIASPSQSTSSLVTPSENSSMASESVLSKVEIKEKKSGWSWKLGRPGKKDKVKDDMEAQDKARLKQLKADQDSVVKEKSKDKEKSILSSLFSGGRKKVGILASDNGRAINQLSPSPGQAKAGNFSNFMHRYPINVERAVYRLSHIKLANPRRPLYEQVLISNLMFWYLSVINKAQMTANQPALIQQQKMSSTQIINQVSSTGLGDAAIPILGESSTGMSKDSLESISPPPRPPSPKGTAPRSTNFGTLRPVEIRSNLQNQGHHNMQFYQKQQQHNSTPPNVYSHGPEAMLQYTLQEQHHLQQYSNSTNLLQSASNQQVSPSSNGFLTSNPGPSDYNQKKVVQPVGGRKPGRNPETAVKQPQYDLQSREIEMGMNGRPVQQHSRSHSPSPPVNIRTASPVSAPLMAGYTSAPPSTVSRNNIDSFPIFVDGGPSSLGPAGFLQDGSAYPSMQQRIPVNNIPTFISPQQTFSNISPRSSGIQPGQVFVFPSQHPIQPGPNYPRPSMGGLNTAGPLPGNSYSNASNVGMNQGRRSASSPPPGSTGFSYNPPPLPSNKVVYQPPAPFQFMGQQQQQQQQQQHQQQNLSSMQQQRAMTPPPLKTSSNDQSANVGTGVMRSGSPRIGLSSPPISPVNGSAGGSIGSTGNGGAALGVGVVGAGVVLPPGVGRPQMRGVSNPGSSGAGAALR